MIVLSHFRRTAPASLHNHRYYARRLGYRHDYNDATAVTDRRPLCLLYKYEWLLHTLRRAAEGESVLLLSEDAAIVRVIPLERVLGDRNWLLARTSGHVLPQIDVQIWRNTPAGRAAVEAVVRRCRLGGEPVDSEAALFEGLETVHYQSLIDGVCPVMGAGYNYDPVWSRVPTFSISIDDAPEMPSNKGVTPRFRDILVTHVNGHLASGLPLFDFPVYEAPDSAERSTYGPFGSRIALTTLYTSNIDSYGRIAERNFRRYCEAHGYTLYVHRDIPKEVGLEASGNWFKPWLLHAYLQHHEWVFWIDADVLIADLDQPLEPLLDNRDWLLARDVGQWAFNSGVMGFRRTERNNAMLGDLMADIAGVVDRSSVYASNGDQMYFIEAMNRAGLLDDAPVLDSTVFNTPWTLRRPDSFIVHYYGMWTEMRALMMAHDDALLD
ncbi:galactosyl transferase GMA12/MNN10 domain protein [Paraburkholderia sp.]|uniref:galactosyl transferase GMA12/MNN10 domain protein n=1 Tax=Paraburkholderia sp. TaxID=1926495 RepID=UPI003D6DC162